MTSPPNANGGRSSCDAAAKRSRRSSTLHRPVRKRPAHFSTVQSGNRAQIVFVTLCTKRRRPLLANATAFSLILDAWRKADRWLVGRYVIMPDHIHFFCAPNRVPPESLKSWVNFWRNNVTRGWSARGDLPLWQRDYWDRQLRRADSYAAKWEYVRNNPARHGHVSNSGDWPYQGELNILEWHD
jgi:putative transposase